MQVGRVHLAAARCSCEKQSWGGNRHFRLLSVMMVRGLLVVSCFCSCVTLRTAYRTSISNIHFIPLVLSALDTSVGSNPVPESSHSSINTRLIGLATFISPAHYSSKVPDISSIWSNQWSSGVTLRKKGETAYL